MSNLFKTEFATFTTGTPLVAGTTNGASGSPQWVLTQSSTVNPPVASYATLSCTSCTSPTLLAQHESDGCSVYNVQVKTSYGGFLSDPLYIYIERPKFTVKPTESNRQDRDEPNGTGYVSLLYYKVRVLCAAQKELRGYKVNETFGAKVNDWPGATWPNFVAGGTSVGLSDPTEEAFVDTIAVPSGGTPASQNPLTPRGTEKVDHASQTWKIGSISVGQGIDVQTNTLQRYRDHAEHSGRTTPVN